MTTKGLVHIYTGDGKGKTSTAVGMAVRAAGQQKRVYFLQFLKARPSGETVLLNDIPYLTLKRANSSSKFFFQMDDREKSEVKQEIAETWKELSSIISGSEYDIIILDEVMSLISNQLLDLKELIKLIKQREPGKELIFTGRDAPKELIELADYVTEMKMVKHPYQQNILPRKGIEF